MSAVLEIPRDVQALEPEAASSHLRNALQILRTSPMLRQPGHAVVCDALDQRIVAALRQAEESESKVTILKEMVRAGADDQRSLTGDLQQRDLKIARLETQLEIARGNHRAGSP